MKRLKSLLLGMSLLSLLLVQPAIAAEPAVQPEYVYHCFVRLFDGDKLVMETELPLLAEFVATANSGSASSTEVSMEEQLARVSYLWIGGAAAMATEAPGNERAELALSRSQRLSLGGMEFAVFDTRANRISIDLWRAKSVDVPWGVHSEDSAEPGDFRVEGPVFDRGHPAWQQISSYEGLLEMRR